MHYHYDLELDLLCQRAQKAPEPFALSTLTADFRQCFGCPAPIEKRFRLNRSNDAKIIKRIRKQLLLVLESFDNAEMPKEAEPSFELDLSSIVLKPQTPIAVDIYSEDTKVKHFPPNPSKRDTALDNITLSGLKHKMDEECEKMLMENDKEEELLLAFLEGTQKKNNNLETLCAQTICKFSFFLQKEFTLSDLAILISEKMKVYKS